MNSRRRMPIPQGRGQNPITLSARTCAAHRCKFARRGRPTRSSVLLDFVSKIARARQNDREFRELTWRRVHLDPAAVLLHDDVVAHREAKAGAFAGRLGGEKRIEHLCLHLGRNPGAVVADAYLDAVPEISGCSAEHRLKTCVISLRLSL